MPETYRYQVDLDERGEFGATLYNSDDEVMTSFDTEEVGIICEAGYMKHSRDVAGLKDFLIMGGFMGAEDKITISG